MSDGASHAGTVPPLADLGQSFLPIDPGEKGPRVPRVEEYLRHGGRTAIVGTSTGIQSRTDARVKRGLGTRTTVLGADWKEHLHRLSRVRS